MIVSNSEVETCVEPDRGMWCLRVVLVNIFARFGPAVLLLIAASLKVHQLFIDPALGVLYGSRLLQTGLVEYELLLAIWLFYGIGLRWGRRIAFITFISFGCYAFFLGVLGKESCGCFGNAHVSPWWTFSIDTTLTFLLFIWKPQHVKRDFESGLGCLHFTARAVLAIPAVCAVIGIPISIALWQPGSDSSLESSLANSHFVLLEPEKWIGKPFPLTEYIDIAKRDRLSRGSWFLVFYHHNCPKCQRALLQYEWLSEQLKSANDDTNIALIEVPPYGPAFLSANPLCHHGRLSDSKEWLIKTPAEVRVTNGQVIAATSELVPERPW